MNNAKKTRTKTVNVKDEVQSDLNTLKDAIKPKSDIPLNEIKIETPEIKTEIPIEIPLNKLDTEIPVSEIKTEIPQAKRTLSIWNDIKKKTEEDKTIVPVTTKIEDVAEKLTQSATLNNEAQEDEIARKEACKAKASIIVEVADTVIGLCCCALMWDFGDTMQKKFSLHAERKKAIENNLYKILMLSKKMPNPSKDIVWLILGSYAPMLLVALIGMFNRLKRKKEDQAKENEYASIVSEYKNKEALRFQEINERDRQILELQNKLNSPPTAEEKKNYDHFTNAPKLGKDKKQKIYKDHNLKTRGVKPGTPRGPYKKRK